MLPWLVSLVGFSILSAATAAVNAAGLSHLKAAPHHLRTRSSVPADPPVKDGVEFPSYETVYTFDQLIDHTNPSLGTFKQRYYFTYEYYEQGGPIILSTPGEEAMDGLALYVTNQTIAGIIAQATKGAVVFLEHRYFGLSSPYPDLSEESLRFHTLEQAIDDFVYFAKTAVLPMPGGDCVGADTTPWLLFGGSYPGALVNWIMNAHPGVFWAGYSSSGVVETISDYWSYYEPIRQNMPQNCSADIERVIEYVDQTFASGSSSDINALKARFGLSNVTHLDDAAYALSLPFREWQERQPAAGPGDNFTRFCDALEIKDGIAASSDGWGLEHAIRAFGRYMRTVYLPYTCGDDSDIEACVGTYNRTLPRWTDTTVGNWVRSWQWLLCNDLGFWMGGAPSSLPTLVSRLITPAYFNRQCSNYFPKAFPTDTSADPKAQDVNAKYGGWNVTAPRVFFANGKRDPWREATVSSDSLSLASTELNPIAVSDGYHCNDMLVANAIDPTIARVQELAIQYFTQWVNDFQSRSASSA
ncbi:hypothetical protein BOTBODRAFT_444845 [Botryobasidium botryosum FD-172 SS1]|uniref:Peptidase S28 n=1 Tax=Botryobasidium botryosum (strain FD-172 SS1) TaxID=930990 RepID=A0A067MV73_BOTB1|nr:hypothetical protein BOTBODRAFT_444845 [Botryobasidium botryosum FD-172 SS1]